VPDLPVPIVALTRPSIVRAGTSGVVPRRRLTSQNSRAACPPSPRDDWTRRCAPSRRATSTTSAWAPCGCGCSLPPGSVLSLVAPGVPPKTQDTEDDGSCDDDHECAHDKQALLSLTGGSEGAGTELLDAFHIADRGPRTRRSGPRSSVQNCSNARSSS
jgi:hypothetical protein